MFGFLFAFFLFELLVIFESCSSTFFPREGRMAALLKWFAHNDTALGSVTPSLGDKYKSLVVGYNWEPFLTPGSS